ncbi:16S rRNA (cytosine(1402)-N(4))-methyltransferase [Candidatus Saccharibacteria bacterium CG_4_10_14_0_2_um_filter_52_9]|nr:MAG: 16S rRNA (cytosine(1402)-N(4))-methyltransferase [Candidatus Saccharibacteria bacterium CG_4_10_14_0_2_um_filter_52_9]
MHQNKHQNKQHVPVLMDEVLQYLDPQAGESYLDLTAGYGGHASAILARTGSLTQAVLVDRDQNAIRVLQERTDTGKAELRQQDFLSAATELLAVGRQFDLILADLGVSSPHLNEGSRGFSIATNGPLDMRMDQSQELTAATIVNSYSQADLAALIKQYGEEPKAKRIATAIVQARPLETTGELAAIAAKAWPGRSRVHPATRTFQALRIAVNDELGLLQQALPLWFELLAPAGRIAIISFHSLEDRLVKQALKEVASEGYDAELGLLTKRPVTAPGQELVFNPRARSAKLRAAVKIKKKGNSHANPGKK